MWRSEVKVWTEKASLVLCLGRKGAASQAGQQDSPVPTRTGWGLSEQGELREKSGGEA